MPIHRNSSVPHSETNSTHAPLAAPHTQAVVTVSRHAAADDRPALHEALQTDSFADETVMLAARNLSKRFQLHAVGATVDAFSGVGFDVRAGRFFGLTGASGSGKSSILKCL